MHPIEILVNMALCYYVAVASGVGLFLNQKAHPTLFWMSVLGIQLGVCAGGVVGDGAV
jgi:hypothetical protein